MADPHADELQEFFLNSEARADTEEFHVTISPSEAFTHAEREINAHLNALGYVDAWSPSRDRQMAEALVRGQSPEGVAGDLGVDRAAVLGRYTAINTDVGNLDHQTRLLRVLQFRAE